MAGGCTTHLARLLLQLLSERGYDIIGYPRLVRLNPSIPWKTRGNGAVAFQVGHGGGGAFPLASFDGYTLCAREQLQTDLDRSDFEDIGAEVDAAVSHHAYLEDRKTNPGVVMLSQPPPRQMYTDAVTSVVSIHDVLRSLTDLNARVTRFKNGRGVVGASAAIAWVPGDCTYELISYRERSQWGTPRDVDDGSVQRMDHACPTTFDNYDYRQGRCRIAPNSPCPILHGIRGDDPGELLTASGMVVSEPVESWVLFQTNQGTDDHLLTKAVADIGTFQSVKVTGTVTADPRTLPGGHVVFSLADASGAIACAAYEPTKEFRTVVRQLRSGDVVTACGSIRTEPRTVNLEKLQVHTIACVTEKVANPRCPSCSGRMRSKGTGQGYACERCGTKQKTATFKAVQRSLVEGLYEVPVCARRHLSKPLKRLQAPAPLPRSP